MSPILLVREKFAHYPDHRVAAINENKMSACKSDRLAMRHLASELGAASELFRDSFVRILDCGVPSCRVGCEPTICPIHSANRTD